MPKPTTTTAQVTIPAGGSLSDSADLTAGNMVMLLSPVDWTPANVTFQISEDNVNFRGIYDDDGTEIVNSMGPSRAVNVDPSFTSGALYVKIVSGRQQHQVPQAADRIFTIVIQ
jgi:hypothetical protein